MEAYPVVKTIKERRSVRTYTDQPVDPLLMDKIKGYITHLSNPFGAKVEVKIAHKALDADGEKLGTYGFIKGATTFLGLSVAKGERALLGAGYAFEDLILYATSLGLGTVWLAATFTRSKFQKAMAIPDDYLFPAISPIGYPKEKRLMERLMRKTIGADKRKPWHEIFFDGTFGSPLSWDAAGCFATALEMLRLAPSATNAQPWRVLKIGDTVHFYETHKAKAKEDDVQIKQVDMGIGIFHFDKTLQSEGVNGTFSDNPPKDIAIPEDYHYVVSWALVS